MRLDTTLLANCRVAPHKDAIVCGDERLSFDELGKSLRSLATGLREQGIRPGDRIILYMPNCPQFIQIMFASFACGAVVVPVTTRLTLRELDYFCSDSDAKMIVCHVDQAAGVADVLAAHPGVTGVSVGAHPGFLEFGKLRLPEQPLPVLPGDLDECMIMYTSGTTGRPKGVVMTHANLLIQSGYMNALDWGMSSEDCFLVVAPMAHRSGMGRLLNAMVLGGTIVVLGRFDPDEVMATIEREKITVFGMVPTMCRMLMPALEAEPARGASLRRIIVTGEAFPVPLKRKLMTLLPDVELYSFFGITEAGCVTNLSHGEQVEHADSVGRPVRGVETRIVDTETGVDLETGEIGELLVRTGKPGSFAVMKEYLNRPQDTAKAIRDGWFHTGDMARVDDDGYIYIVDRKKDMILSGGFNIYSKEVEITIAELAGIADVAVVGVPDPVFGEAVTAFIEPENGATPPDRDAVIEHCRISIAGYKKPKYVFYRTTLPRNAMGKVLKHELAAIAREDVDAMAARQSAENPDGAKS